MLLYKWANGLKSRLFNNGVSNVRLYCADGQVLFEIYERNRQEGDSVYDKERAAQDFFREVIKEVFQNPMFNPDLKKGRPFRISEIAHIFEARERDWRILPLCFFFAAVWSIDFRDENDPYNDSDYRQHRFAEALRWGSEGMENVNLEYDRGTQNFSGGIERLFDLLAKEYKEQVFMPPPDFKYGPSRADGITISHSIFRYGDIANIYTAFSDWGLEPYCEYDEVLFLRIANEYYDSLRNRCIDRQTLQVAVEQLYRGWDGTAVKKNYRNYIAHHSDVVDKTIPGGRPNNSCKAYWALIPDSYNQFRIGICLDKVYGLANNIVACNGNGHDAISIPSEVFAGVSCWQWLESGDPLTGMPGWTTLKSENKISFSHEGVVLDTIAPFNMCFDGHAIILLQSYIPPSGDNPIWRLMVGSQGIELWSGDGRRSDTQYAFLSPVEMREKDVQCEGMEHIEDIGNVLVNETTYHVYRLCGDLSGDLVVNGGVLFNFGVPHEERDAREYFISERVEVRRLYGRRFVAPPRMTVFYLPEERRIAIYCPQGNPPSLYGVSEMDISSCEIEPLAGHRLDFDFDEGSDLWLTEEMDVCDIPYAIGILADDNSRMQFVVVDSDGEDYHVSWKGYFLPKLEERDLIITGALLARGWRPEITRVLRDGVEENLAIEGSWLHSLLTLLEDVQIADVDRKVSFIRDIGSMLTTRLVNGMPHNASFGNFREVFRQIPGELEAFLGGIPNNGRLANLNEYFAWALILLTIYYDRVGVQDNDFNRYMRFKRTLTDFTPNPDLPSRHYCSYFVCIGIVHAVLDGVNEEEAKRIVSRGVALADRIVSQLA